MDPRRRTLASGDHFGGTHIPVPSSAVRRPHPHLAASTRETGSRFSLAPQRLASHAGAARQSSVATSSNFQFSQQSDFHAGQAAPFSTSKNPQYHDSVRRASVYQAPQTIIRQSVNSSNFPASSRSAMSVNRNENAHYRSSSVHDLPPTATPNFHSTPSANRASSMGPPQGSHFGSNSLLPPFQTFKDPRPRDKRTLALWQNEVYEFLQERGYQEPLTLKTLQTPTTKDFHNIFRFIVQCSDHNHQWGIYGKKLEDEIIPILKTLGYVSYDTLTKSGLQAPGSMHVWPTLLAMLHWIVTSIKLREEAMANDQIRLDPTIEPTSDDSRSEGHVAISHWLHFLEQTYQLFLQADDFDREFYKPALEDYFQKRKDRVLSEIERLETSIVSLTNEHEKLAKTSSPLEAAKKEHEKLERDTERFLEYIGRLRESSKKCEKATDALKKSLEVTEAQVKEATKQKAELAIVVDKQNISDVELQQISSSRSQLERSSAAAITKRDQLTELMLDLEVRVQQASDRVEKLLTTYNNKAVKLGLIPRAPEPFENLDFSQHVNGGAAEVANMLPDPTKHIKPALLQLKKNTMDSRFNLGDQVLAVEAKLGGLKETLQEKSENLSLLENSVKQLAKQLEDDKEKFAVEIGMMNDQIDLILKKVSETESTIENNRMTIDHEIQALRVRFDETQERISKMTKDNVDEMNSILTFIVLYKERMKTNTLHLKHLSESTGGPSINIHFAPTATSTNNHHGNGNGNIRI